MSEECATPSQIQDMSRDAIRELQERRLADLCRLLHKENSFYRAKFDRAGVRPGDIRTLDDLRRLEFTKKAELVADQADHPPYGTNLTYPIHDFVRLHQTSGTTGRPLRWLDTEQSWSWFMGLWTIIFDGAGLRPEDRLFFPFSFGPFLAFWAAFDASAALGHLTLPGGAMNTPARLRFMHENQASIVCCTPTYALHMAEVAEKEGIDLRGGSVRALIVAGEPGGSIPETRGKIEEAWGARVFDHTGMTEIGPLGFECVENPGGLHLMEPEFIVEVINPESDEPVGEGERGEVVVTNLGREGSPLVRYRTGDLVQVDPEPCACGRKLMRIKGGVLGRIDDMVIVRGNNIYPAALESVLRRFHEITEYRAEVSSREGLAVLTLTVESSGQIRSNGPSLPDRIGSAVKVAFNFRPEVTMVEAGTLPRFELKASRFIIHPSYKEDSA